MPDELNIGMRQRVDERAEELGWKLKFRGVGNNFGVIENVMGGANKNAITTSNRLLLGAAGQEIVLYLPFFFAV